LDPERTGSVFLHLMIELIWGKKEYFSNVPERNRNGVKGYLEDRGWAAEILF
jgi:hypothetical protein